MLEKTPDHDQRPESDERPVITLGALAFARTVAAAFAKLETGYRNGLYDCIGAALTWYRKFLKDPAGYEELLTLPNISRATKETRGAKDVAAGPLLPHRR